jgi:chorismate dehydratase
LKESHIITDYCIGADGPVKSVLLYSDVPLNEIRSVMLDNQSRTSIALVKILCKYLWKIDPEWTMVRDGYETDIRGEVAGVVIGDRTFGLRNKFRYTFDLSEAWKTLTGLPFVFACWVSNKPIDTETEHLFNDALRLGVGLTDEVAKKFRDNFPSGSDIQGYLGSSISFNLDVEKRKGLKRFLELLATMNTSLASV